jgi:hypothetical protein
MVKKVVRFVYDKGCAIRFNFDDNEDANKRQDVILCMQI